MNVRSPTGWLDAHAHLWAVNDDPSDAAVVPPELLRAFEVDELLGGLRATPVEQVILVESGSEEDDLERLRANADGSAEIAGYVSYGDLDPARLAQRLVRLAGDPKWVGVRFRFEGQAAEVLASPDFLRALEVAAAFGIVAEYLVTTDHLSALREQVRSVPQLRGVVEHMGKPDLRTGGDRADWAREVRALADETGLLMKLSASPRASDLRWLAARGHGWTNDEIDWYVTECVRAFGPSRLMWGSDWPVAAIGRPYETVVDLVPATLATLSPEERSLILGGNARRVYGVR